MSVLAVLILLVGLLAGAVIIALLLRQQRGGAGAPACGGCGYEVAGLETLRCPECGADLREIGIVTPAMTRGVPRGALRVALLVVITLLFWPIAMRTTQFVRLRTGVWTTTTVCTYQASGDRRSDMELAVVSEGRPARAQRVALRFADADGMRLEFVVDPQTRRFSASDQPGFDDDRVDSGAIADWLARSGYGGKAGPLASDELQDVADHMLGQLEQRLASPMGSVSTGGSDPFNGVSVTTNATFQPRRGAAEGTFLGALVLWAVLCWFVWRRTRVA